jgi:hypothetical protein
MWLISFKAQEMAWRDHVLDVGDPTDEMMVSYEHPVTFVMRHKAAANACRDAASPSAMDVIVIYSAIRIPDDIMLTDKQVDLLL